MNFNVMEIMFVYFCLQKYVTIIENYYPISTCYLLL